MSIASKCAPRPQGSSLAHAFPTAFDIAQDQRSSCTPSKMLCLQGFARARRGAASSVGERAEGKVPLQTSLALDWGKGMVERERHKPASQSVGTIWGPNGGSGSGLRTDRLGDLVCTWRAYVDSR